MSNSIISRKFIQVHKVSFFLAFFLRKKCIFFTSILVCFHFLSAENIGKRCFSTKVLLEFSPTEFETSKHIIIEGLTTRVKELVPEEQAKVKDIIAKYGDKQIGSCTVLQAFQGMRGVKCMVTETSLLDENEVEKKFNILVTSSTQKPPIGI